MKRQHFAFCLGILFGSSAMAQPSSDTERYPPAPEMPGVVVSQPSGVRPSATVTAMNLKPVTHVQSTPIAAPVISATQLPYTNVTTAEVIPGPLPLQSAPSFVPGATPCNTPDCGAGQSTKLQEWFHFHSTSKQTGCYPMPYSPPLQAWFPCKPGAGHCYSPAAAPNCASGHCGTTVIPVLAANNAVPVNIVPNQMVPVASQNMGPNQMVPVNAVNQPVPLSNVPNVRPIYNVELIPNGQPVGPSLTPTKMESTQQLPNVDPLSNFRKLDGMTFTPGGSPMAAPVKPVSKVK